MSSFTGSKHSQLLNISSHFEALLAIQTPQPMFKRQTQNRMKGWESWGYPAWRWEGCRKTLLRPSRGLWDRWKGTFYKGLQW